jgi:hypothetical protein
MAHQTQNRLFSLFGLVIWGDFADLTMYRSKRGTLVIFKKTWPDEPPSIRQLYDQAKFKAAAADWQTLTTAQRTQWHLASRRASLCMHGYNLYVHWHTTRDDSAIQTLQRQTHTTLLP